MAGSALTNNVVLMGVPRSGTTLTCSLLNELPDVVALHEPLVLHDLPRIFARRFAMTRIHRFFRRTRQQLLTKGTAPSKVEGGRVPDNPISDAYDRTGLRVKKVHLGVLKVEKRLSPDFLLAVKQPGSFTALLPEIADQFPCHAIVRNPLSVLTSWGTVPIPVTRGTMPGAERLSPTLREQLAGRKDVRDRQLVLLSWFYQQYRAHLPASRVLRYEDLIQSQGRVLEAVTPKAAQLRRSLSSRNLNSVYDREKMKQLGARLLASEGGYWNFYSRDDVATLLGQLESTPAHAPPRIPT